jgi:catechol 2,3-dioxygenase-like lactoylglutathione lyase family enzyme
MPNFIQVTPFLHVPDINAAVQWFHDTLGFELILRQSDYAYMEREGVGFRLLQQSGENIMDGNRRFAYYIDVRDLDALYAELKPKLDQMPPRDVYGPVNQAYGQRELLVLAPDGNLIAFGQAIEGNRQ